MNNDEWSEPGTDLAQFSLGDWLRSGGGNVLGKSLNIRRDKRLKGPIFQHSFDDPIV
jgi:hypothetical protein